MLDKQSVVPLYHQLRENIRKWIEDGMYKPGDLLPPESELENSFNVSRITVRRAIEELVQEGFLEKNRGKGTFVREPKITQNLNQITSWAETIMAMGMTTQTMECKMEEIEAPAWVAHHLNASPGEKVIKVWRVRYANEEPMCIMSNYLLSKYVPNILEESLQGESLYQLLERRYKIVIEKAVETVEAVVASKSQAKLLGIKEKSPLLCVTRITYDANGVPFDVVKAYNRADRYQYSTVLVGRPKNSL